MTQACPVSREYRDERTIRTTAAFVIAVVAIAILTGGTGAGVIMLALAVDFALRASGDPSRSPMASVAGVIVSLLPGAAVVVDAAPKRFAARLGVGFSLAATVLFIAHLTAAASLVAGLLAICALLEAAFGVCVGCKVYGLLTARRPPS